MFKLLIPLLVFQSAFANNNLIDKTWETLVAKNKLNIEKQAYCIGDDHKTLYERNGDMTIKPASVSKIYTTYFAFKKLGLNYRHTTTLLLDSKAGHLHIQGGNDPYFVDENMAFILNQLEEENLLNIKKISFDKKFYFDWDKNPSMISKILKQRLNNGRIADIYKETYQKSFPSFKHIIVTLIDRPALKITHTFKYQTAPIVEQFKYINMFSNNFYTDNIFFDSLGGPEAFSEFMMEEFNAGTDKIKFQTGSGLPFNYTTCNLTLELFRKLEAYLADHEYNLSDIMSVAGVDKGTLYKRFTGKASLKSVIAKTGTLRDTSTLAGKLHAQSGDFYFGVFNNTWDKVATRQMQNQFVKFVIGNFGGKVEIPYEKIVFRADQNNIWEKRD